MDPYDTQCTGSNTEEDNNDDAYIELGNVSSVDLVSFAYQITSGMVNFWSLLLLAV